MLRGTPHHADVFIGSVGYPFNFFDRFMSQPNPSNAATAAWKPGVNPWWIAVAVMLATILEVLDTSVANVALPQMAGSMASSLDEATWVLTSYLVANAIVLPMTGWLSTFFGRKRFLIVCTVLFTVSSAACGAAGSMGMLILARVIQGAAGGALLPISQAILMESFPPAKRGMAMAVYGMGVVVAPIFGPVLGGWLTDNYTWRWIFYINIPFGVLAVLMLHAFVEDPPYLRVARAKSGGKIDGVGFGAMAIWLATLQIVLDRGQQDDWFNAPWICWASAISFCSMLFFIYWEIRTPHPIVDLRVFRNRCFAIGTFLMAVAGVMLYSTTSLLPMFLQGLMQYPALNSGVAMSLRGVGAIVAMIVIGKLSEKIDARLLMNVGWIFLIYSAWELGNITTEISPANLNWPNVMTGLGMGFMMVPLMTAAFANLANEQMGNASGVFNLARNIGGGIGISLTTTLVARGTQVHQALMVAHLSPYRPEFQQYFQSAAGMLAQQSHPVVAQGQAYGLLYGAVQQQAYLFAFVDTFRLLALVCLFCIPVVFLLKKVKSGGGAVAIH
jgi:MFS transporter, DHA2 family, multidrug resistance protein